MKGGADLCYGKSLDIEIFPIGRNKPNILRVNGIFMLSIRGSISERRLVRLRLGT